MDRKGELSLSSEAFGVGRELSVAGGSAGSAKVAAAPQGVSLFLLLLSLLLVHFSRPLSCWPTPCLLDVSLSLSPHAESTLVSEKGDLRPDQDGCWSPPAE